MLTGCRREVVPVSGRVTLDGKPLAGARVTFQPHADRKGKAPDYTGSVGRTDSDGKYSLKMVRPERRGAAVGLHSVTISTDVGGSLDEPAGESPLPKIWANGSQRFRVPPGGTREANFVIVAEPEPDMLPATKGKTKSKKSTPSK